MDYKEKYDAALERARELSKTVTGANYEYIFPELKESEDERTRKELIEFLKLPHSRFVGNREHEKWIAWLEKQGGQKSADEAEPKFKLYDWVVTDKGDTVQIGAVNNGYYTMGNGMDFNSFYVDRCWHKWTIQDAKDGDLIYARTEVKGVQAIFHKFENGIIYFHCNLCGDFTQGGYEPSGDVEFVTPLPKTDCQRFFQKMKETGYEWDSNKKELKKMKVANKESYGEKTRKAIISGMIALKSNQNMKTFAAIPIDDCIAWLEKQGKQTHVELGQSEATKTSDQELSDKIEPKFKAGDEVYNRFDKSLGHVVIESVDDTTYYGDTTNFDITDQDQWGIVRSCENCKCGYYSCKGYPTVSCYLHEDCGGDTPIIISDDDFVETAMTCKEFEQEN